MSDMYKKSDSSPDTDRARPVEAEAESTSSRGANAAGAAIGLLLVAGLGVVLLGALAAASNSSRGRKNMPRRPRASSALDRLPVVRAKAPMFDCAAGKPYPPPRAFTQVQKEKIPIAPPGVVLRERLPVVSISVAGVALLLVISFALMVQLSGPEPTSPSWAAPIVDRKAAAYSTTIAKMRPATTTGTPSRR